MTGIETELLNRIKKLESEIKETKNLAFSAYESICSNACSGGGKS